MAGRLIGADAERARDEVAEIEDVARQALREVREAVTGYRRATIAVEAASARAALAAAGITWSEDIDPEITLAVVPAEVEAVLAWAVREGVTNLLRHSRAHTCSLVVSAAGGVASVVVTDDGVGCVGGSGGSGLAGLSERAAEVAGVVEAGPGPSGEGFRLRVAVPLEPASGATCPTLRAQRDASDTEPLGARPVARTAGAAADPPRAR